MKFYRESQNQTKWETAPVRFDDKLGWLMPWVGRLGVSMSDAGRVNRDVRISRLPFPMQPHGGQIKQYHT